MLNFTVGPVQSDEYILDIGSEQVPYFRTPEFSKLMLENEELMKKFVFADEGARTVFITGSGTAAMEAAVINTLTKSDRVLIVNGGSFGQRFVDICKLHRIQYDEIRVQRGKQLTTHMLDAFDGSKYTAFLVNIHETSTGVLYNLELISKYCEENNLFLIVDAISSFLADKIDMKSKKIDMLLTGSQKALACPPGISIIVMSPRAVSRVEENVACCMYLDLKDALKNGERGQTPFTPAVSILIQINKRLKMIDAMGGVEVENKRIAGVAEDFRTKIRELPFEIVSEEMSNAVTPLHPLNASAYDIFIKLKDEYGIWVCPNGGDTKDYMFRVGHIGALTYNDNDVLINALKDLRNKGII